AHHLERRPDVLLGKKQGDALGRVVTLGQDVVFGVKPEDDVDATLLRPLGSERARSGNKSAREKPAEEQQFRQPLHLYSPLGTRLAVPAGRNLQVVCLSFRRLLLASR